MSKTVYYSLRTIDKKSWQGQAIKSLKVHELGKEHSEVLAGSSNQKSQSTWTWKRALRSVGRVKQSSFGVHEFGTKKMCELTRAAMSAQLCHDPGRCQGQK